MGANGADAQWHSPPATDEVERDKHRFTGSRFFLSYARLDSDTGHFVPTTDLAEFWYHFAALRCG